MRDGEAFPKIYGGVDYGVPLPMPNSSLWVYAHAGLGWGERRQPARPPIYFGSFRNNYVDNRPEKRYREMESFPGFEIDEIAARRFAKLTGEMNLPPVRFAEVGTPAFYPELCPPGAVRRQRWRRRRPDGTQPPLFRRRRAARPQLHRRAAAADGVFGRRGRAASARRPLSQDRMARLAEDHVSDDRCCTEAAHWGLALVPVLRHARACSSGSTRSS